MDPPPLHYGVTGTNGQHREWTRTNTKNLKANRRWTQIYADKMGVLRSSQENLAAVGRCLVRSITDFTKVMNEPYPEIHNRTLSDERDRGRQYLRKSAFICGSFLSYSCSFVSIRG